MGRTDLRNPSFTWDGFLFSTSKSRRGPVLKLTLFAGILGACLAAFVYKSGAFTNDANGPVFTEAVVKGDVEETALSNGVLEAAQTVSVGAQVSGQLRVLSVGLGQLVKQGELIAEMDSTTQRNALRIAEAAYANVVAQRRARGIELAQARREHDRHQKMLSRRVISQVEFEAAEASVQSLQAQVEALDAEITEASVEVENARVDLGYTRIVAPMDGTVVAVVTKAGQTLNSSQAAPTIVVLAQLDTMRVKVQISEADIGRVRVGQEARFTIMGDSHATFRAALDQIEPAPASIASESSTTTVSAASGTTAVYYNGLLSVPNPDGKLRPLMTAQVTIVVGRVDNVLLVPWAALTRRDANGQYRVEVRTAHGALEERKVSIGLTDRLKAQVLDGLALGETVVIPTDGQLSDPTEEL